MVNNLRSLILCIFSFSERFKVNLRRCGCGDELVVVMLGGVCVIGRVVYFYYGVYNLLARYQPGSVIHSRWFERKEVLPCVVGCCCCAQLFHFPLPFAPPHSSVFPSSLYSAF